MALGVRVRRSLFRQARLLFLAHSWPIGVGEQVRAQKVAAARECGHSPPAAGDRRAAGAPVLASQRRSRNPPDPPRADPPEELRALLVFDYNIHRLGAYSRLRTLANPSAMLILMRTRGRRAPKVLRRGGVPLPQGQNSGPVNKFKLGVLTFLRPARDLLARGSGSARAVWKSAS